MPLGYEQCDRNLKELINQGGGGGSSSSGGSFIAGGSSNKVILAQETGTVDIGIAGFNKDFDVLFVFKNSTFMTPGTYYTVISSTQIQATSGATWEAGTEFDFVALMNKRAPSALKQACIKNSKTINVNTPYIDIGIDSFDLSNDTFLLYKNGVYQEVNLHYVLDEKRIYPKDDSNFIASAENPVTFNWLIFRNVADYATVTQMDGKYIKDNTISYDKIIGGDKVGDLSSLKTTAKSNAVGAINELKDANDAQNNTIGTGILQTNNKTLIPAINELFQSGVNLQNTSISALNAAGISYANTQLSTLINTMANNLYTRSMHNIFINKLNSVAGSTIANSNNTFTELVNMIDSVGKPQIQTRTINTLDDWTHHEVSSVKPDDITGYIDFNYNGSLSVRIMITQWNSDYDNDWYVTQVQFYNNKINYVQITSLTSGWYDSTVDTNYRNNDPSMVQIYNNNNISASIVTSYTDGSTSSATFANVQEIWLLANGNKNAGYGRKINRGFTITAQ